MPTYLHEIPHKIDTNRECDNALAHVQNCPDCLHKMIEPYMSSSPTSQSHLTSYFKWVVFIVIVIALFYFRKS